MTILIKKNKSNELEIHITDNHSINYSKASTKYICYNITMRKTLFIHISFNFDAKHC